MHTHTHTAVTIGFELTEHTVSENDVEVTLMVSILEGQTSLPVTIALSTVDGTATSKYRRHNYTVSK